MIAPVAFCLNCDGGIYQSFQDWDKDNTDGEPQFCCLKCKTEYIKKYGKPFGWKQAWIRQKEYFIV